MPSVITSDTGAKWHLDTNITDAIERWVEQGLPPGSFTSALLRGDYAGIEQRAHPTIRNDVPDYISYVEYLASGKAGLKVAVKIRKLRETTRKTEE